MADAELPDELDDVICDVATLVAYGRASVPRDWKREVDGVVTVEDPAGSSGNFAYSLSASSRST